MTKQYRQYNIQIDNKIKLHILGVWQNANQYVRQLVYCADRQTDTQTETHTNTDKQYTYFAQHR